MARPIAFDMTHIVSRLPVSNPSGIDKVDLAFAEYFAGHPSSRAVHYGIRSPRFHPGRAVADIWRLATRERWTGGTAEADPVLSRVKARLAGTASDLGPIRRRGGGAASLLTSRDARERRFTQVKWRLAPGTSDLPDGSIYLNVAQHAFEYPRFFNWLGARPDVLTTFLVHDLLPLDFPEYFRAGYRERFLRRQATILDHARALITTSDVVADRLRQALAEHKRPAVPIHVQPLPSTLPSLEAAQRHDPDLAASPYFMVLGTIEPRKNHLLLLNIWRRMAEDATPAPGLAPNRDPKSVPKLVVVGTRGWENEQVVDVLDRSTLVRPHVIEVSGLGDQALARLIANARGLLMPSFAEGYGLPVVEALSLGVPVVASDIAVFREVAQGRATFVSPIDGPGWRRAVETLAAASPGRQAALEAAAGFTAPTWRSYMDGTMAFLAGL